MNKTNIQYQTTNKLECYSEYTEDELQRVTDHLAESGWEINTKVEDPYIGVDASDMSMSVGWCASEGLLGEKGGEIFAELFEGDLDAYYTWLGSGDVEPVSFEDGYKAVMEHAKQYNATEEELQQLKANMHNMLKEYPEEWDVSYFTWGVETDVNLGVISL